MKQRIFSHTSFLIILSVILTFLAAGTVMYNRYDLYMKQGVRDEVAYIRTGLEEDGEGFLTSKVGDATSSRITLLGKTAVCCLTALRIPLRWKITAIDRNLLRLRKTDSVKWCDIRIPFPSRLSTMQSDWMTDRSSGWPRPQTVCL